MKKILFLATYPTQSNGYARIGNRITNFLSDYYEIHYFGFSNYPGIFIDRKVNSKINLIDVLKEEKDRNFKDNFGVDIINEFVKKINPDIILIYNDIIVTCRHINKLIELREENKIISFENFSLVSYIDLVYDYEKPLYINHLQKHCDKIITFSEHWKDNLMNMKIPEHKLHILYHGIDKELFYEFSKDEARKILNLEPDSFIILNTNRNSYRKAQDITISSFLKFLKMNNFDTRLKLLLHCELKSESGYNLLDIIEAECLKQKIDYETIIQKYIIRLAETRISDFKMNLLYNACDVGINTCIGEGFGLCNLEHASLGKPQIVSNIGGLKDIFKNFPNFTIQPSAEYHISNHTDGHNGIGFICNSQDFTNKLQEMFQNYSKFEKEAIECKKYIYEKFDWYKILNQSLEILKS